MAHTQDIVLLTKELNKLKKDELIDILVKQKLPTSANSEVLVNFVTNLCLNKVDVSKKLNNDALQDNHDDSPCKNETCIKIQGEIDLLKKLTFYLEKRTQEQEDLILLLKQQTNLCNINNDKDNPMPSTSKVKEQHIKVYTNPEINPKGEKRDTQQKLYSNVLKTNPTKTNTISGIPIQSIKGNAQQKTITNKTTRNRFKPIIGSGKNTLTAVKTVPKMGYLHVYRCGPEVTCDDLLKVLSETSPTICFQCEEWNKTEMSSSFKIAFPIEHYKEVYNPDLWPAGAAVRRFTFPKKSNFQDVALVQAVN